MYPPNLDVSTGLYDLNYVRRLQMGFLDGIEKLITGHGSAAILKERIALASDQYAALEKKSNDLQAENERLKLDLVDCKKQWRAVEEKLAHGGNHEKYVCDYCASAHLKRTGTRPHPTFGELGLKEALFRCESCGQESGFELPLR